MLRLTKAERLQESRAETHGQSLYSRPCYDQYLSAGPVLCLEEVSSNGRPLGGNYHRKMPPLFKLLWVISKFSCELMRQMVAGSP